MSIYFSTYNVTLQTFHRTTLSYGLVNLKPLVPGHVLVCPLRIVPRFADLSASEISDLFCTVQRISNMIQRVFEAPAVNIAIQDGAEAGQTVRHVHAHVIPRYKADFEGKGDRVYELLEKEEGDIAKALNEMGSRNGLNDTRRGGFPKVDEESRKARSEEEMRKEAEWLGREMEKEDS
ncbi:MAG: hypothetical protein M1823_000075 [Watsoniomyces obsoletus]|nr:MAG: hypothetical protein M1823_000075 [Watsoniomyces obsoletus]